MIEGIPTLIKGLWLVNNGTSQGQTTTGAPNSDSLHEITDLRSGCGQTALLVDHSLELLHSCNAC